MFGNVILETSQVVFICVFSPEVVGLGIRIGEEEGEGWPGERGTAELGENRQGQATALWWQCTCRSVVVGGCGWVELDVWV